MDSEFSDYIIYVDESGDHSLERVDPEYPIFVLAFCIFNKQHYVSKITPAIQEFKFKHFGHDMVVLHEHEIRKVENDFSMLTNREKREVFMADLNSLIDESNFTLISVIIEKKLLKEKYADPANPYHLALGFGLERIYSFLEEKQQAQSRAHVVFERRGKKEDKDLELVFRQVCDGRNYYGMPLPFNIILADKQTNSGGLQLADLIARPIGRYLLNPKQDNRAYKIMESKFYRSEGVKKKGGD